MSVVFGFLAFAAAAALLTSNFPDSLAVLRAAGRRIYRVDAAVALGAAVGLGLIVHQLHGLLIDRFHADAILSISAPTLIVSAAPVLAAAAGAIRAC